MLSRGLLIVFEGLDRSGKTTQSSLLSNALNKLDIPNELWCYPKRTTDIGKMINSYLNKQIELEDHAVHLIFSANRWETVESMKQKLDNGITLIVDRYAYSGVSYTAAKGLDFEWCKRCDDGLPKPDLVCFMDTKLVDIQNRDSFGQERYERTEFQQVVYKNFNKLFDLNNPSENCLILNAKDSREDIHQSILSRTLDMKRKEKLEPLKTLW